MKHNLVHGWWFIVHSIFILFTLSAIHYSLSTVFAQQGDDLEFILDINSATTALPKIFKPAVDLSGRGFHRDIFWPQGLAAGEVLAKWQDEIGFGGVYRMQYNLWEINELVKDKILQDKLLENYESIIKKISDSGGIVILDIFATPAGMGKVLDRKSAPVDFSEFKKLIKSQIRRLSCQKRYNVWYEVWTAPDLDDFFLGREQEYLNLYRAVGEAAKELSAETKIHIPVGGPGVSWWFQNIDGNTSATPENSLVYDLIKFCYRYRLPLNFISWHAYSTDPKAEKESTRYNKYSVALIRDWLSYFDFDRDTPMIVTEWNYDNGANISSERYERSFICASYILSRIKNMYEAGIDYQTYFCLEDFKNNKEGIIRNTGAFTFDSGASVGKSAPKAVYNVFRMLGNLGSEMFAGPKLNNDFVGVLATKKKDDEVAILIYNYIDPEIVRSYLSDNIASLNKAERKKLANIIKSDKLDKILQQKLNVSRLGLTNRVKAVLKKAQEFYSQSIKFQLNPRSINIGIKDLKGAYLYQRYVVDSGCSLNCAFSPAEEKEIPPGELYKETLTLNPYSVNFIILKKKQLQAASEDAISAAVGEKQQNNNGAR